MACTQPVSQTQAMISAQDPSSPDALSASSSNTGRDDSGAASGNAALHSLQTSPVPSLLIRHGRIVDVNAAFRALCVAPNQGDWRGCAFEACFTDPAVRKQVHDLLRAASIAPGEAELSLDVPAGAASFTAAPQRMCLSPLIVAGREVSTVQVSLHPGGGPRFQTGPSATQENRLQGYRQLAEEEYRFLFESMTQGVVFHDASGQVVHANPAACRILKLTYDELLGQYAAQPGFFIVYEDGAPARPEDFPGVQVLASGQAVFNQVLGIHQEADKEAAPQWILVNAQPRYRSGDSRPYQAVVIFEDITRVTHMEHDLRAAKEQAEYFNRLKSAFLSNLSHEIRIPIDGVLGAMDLFRQSLPPDEVRDEIFDLIDDNARRLISTLDDLVIAAQLQSGQVEVQEEEVAIDELLRGLHAEFEPVARAKHLDFPKPGAAEARTLPSLRTDREKLRIVLRNLLRNALKFTDQGSVEMSVEAQADAYCFRVYDTGIGIPYERQTAIFDRFVQADVDDRQVREGAGLGLSIAHAYVHLLNGTISLRSEPGRGTWVDVSIPNAPTVET